MLKLAQESVRLMKEMKALKEKQKREKIAEKRIPKYGKGDKDNDDDRLKRLKNLEALGDNTLTRAVNVAQYDLEKKIQEINKRKQEVESREWIKINVQGGASIIETAIEAMEIRKGKKIPAKEIRVVPADRADGAWFTLRWEFSRKYKEERKLIAELSANMDKWAANPRQKSERMFEEIDDSKTEEEKMDDVIEEAESLEELLIKTMNYVRLVEREQLQTYDKIARRYIVSKEDGKQTSKDFLKELNREDNEEQPISTVLTNSGLDRWTAAERRIALADIQTKKDTGGSGKGKCPTGKSLCPLDMACPCFERQSFRCPKWHTSGSVALYWSRINKIVNRKVSMALAEKQRGYNNNNNNGGGYRGGHGRGRGGKRQRNW